MNAPANAVVLGVGASGYEEALRFALTDARRTGRPLHLVHILELPAGEAHPAAYGAALDTAKTTLVDATARAEELAGDDVAVTAELIDSGWVVDELVRRTESASLLVLQQRALGRVRRVFVRSTVHGVAGRAPGPVISVPGAWEPERHRRGVVTAAVQNPGEAPGIVHAGFTEARARGARLVVLHAWWLASGCDVLVVDGAMRAGWTARSRAELQPVLAPLRQAFPDVEVELSVRHAPPVEAVLEAAETSDLLVLGRRHHRLPLGGRLGPVVRAALDHGTCPVLVAPEVPVDESRSSTIGSSDLATTQA